MYLQDALVTGRKVRTLAVEDAYTREMLAIEVDASLPALRVVRVLERPPHLDLKVTDPRSPGSGSLQSALHRRPVVGCPSGSMGKRSRWISS